MDPDPGVASDSCSAPDIIQWLDVEIRVAVKACDHCCRRHDKDYRKGGSQADRLRSDIRLFRCVLTCASPEVAVAYFDAVRLAGRSRWKMKRPVSEPGEQQTS